MLADRVHVNCIGLNIFFSLAYRVTLNEPYFCWLVGIGIHCRGTQNLHGGRKTLCGKEGAIWQNNKDVPTTDALGWHIRFFSKPAYRLCKALYV